MRSSLLLLLVVVALSPLRGAESPDFAAEVRPILARHCFKCHGPDEKGRKGKLRLDVRESAIVAAKSGAVAIVPGKPDASELVKRIHSSDDDERMPPPEAKQELSAAQRDILERWIAGGATYTQHWAFQPPVKALPPAGEPNAIDAFVRAALQPFGLQPSPEADRHTLIRRVTLDLLGLPPAPEEVQAFVQDTAPGAWERLVDRLLASPHYGERWARKWMDLARYADTNGYEKDRPRSIWPWRDWVINALNADMPFDQFTIDQLAGDLLPHPTRDQRIATGFHRNTMLNEEGGIDPLEFRFLAMTDRMTTTGATWLGLTLQCCQCHTHKFDPIPHKEYYQVMAFLNNADEPELDLPPPGAEKANAERKQRLHELLEALEGKWPAEAMEITWHPAKADLAGGESGRPQDDGSVLFASPGPDKTTAVFSIESSESEVTHLRLEALADAAQPSGGPGRTPHGNFVLTEITVSAAPRDGSAAPVPVKMVTATADAEQERFPISAAFDGNATTGWAVHQPGKPLAATKTAIFKFQQPVCYAEGVKLTVTLHQDFGGHHTLGRPRLSLGTAQKPSPPSAGPSPVDRAFKQWLATQRAVAVDWTVLRPVRATSNLPLLTIQPDDSVWASGDISKNDVYEISCQTQLRAITAIRLEALPDDRLPGHGPGMAYYEGPKGDFFLSEFQVQTEAGTVLLAKGTDSYSKNAFGPAASAHLAMDGDLQTGWSCQDGQGRAHEAVFTFSEPLTPQDGTFTVKMNFGRHYACSLGRFRISVTTAANAAASRLDFETQRLLTKPDAALSAPERQQLRDAFLLAAPELAEARKEIDALRQPPSYPTTLVMRERPAENPRPTHVHNRGEYLQSTDLIKPAVFSFLNPLPPGAPENRLGFARWLVSRDHPLTARVVVNRQWAAFFGRGIVRTQEDFGFQGDLPSHPALLDWLAVDFMESGWSLKRLHRLIVTSKTYRQASTFTSAGTARDPDNIQLWRGPRHRLDAEIIRDSALMDAGLLSGKIGGPSVFPPQPAGVTTEGTYGAMPWKPSEGEDRFRRSLYTFSKRTAPFALTNTFDAPSGEACQARRDVSNTPLQALSLLNDVVFLEAAQGFGNRLASLPGSVEDRVRQAVFRTFARPAADGEAAALAQFFSAQRQRLEQKELDAGKIAAQGAGNAVDRAAWTLLARVLLNTDEFVTKE